MIDVIKNIKILMNQIFSQLCLENTDKNLPNLIFYRITQTYSNEF